jgi:predicted hydrocarbon binding protein
LTEKIVIEEVEQEVGRCPRLLRDGKAFIMRLVTFRDFKKILEERFGSGAHAIFYEVGKGCGVRSCRRLTQKYKSKGKLLKALTRYKNNEKWGKIKFNLNLKTGTGEIIIAENFEAKQYGKSEEPICYFMKGYLEGFLTQAYSKPLKVVEVACMAQGSKACKFKVEEVKP